MGAQVEQERIRRDRLRREVVKSSVELRSLKVVRNDDVRRVEERSATGEQSCPDRGGVVDRCVDLSTDELGHSND